MKTVAPAAALPARKLKPLLHDKIDQMDAGQLRLLDRILLQLETEELADRLGAAFDQDHAAGKLRRVPEWVQQFRKERRCA